VAIFAGKGKGVIYVQGRQVRTVAEADMLDALYAEVKAFAKKVETGQVSADKRMVTIAAPES